MPRPVNCRRIGQTPCAARFKPAGTPCRDLESVTMTLDEFEAIRLTDLEGMYHAQAAALMGVSRPTLSRIIESAHAKVADMLVHGKELRIEGGSVTSEGVPGQTCPNCARVVAGGTQCPRCRKSGIRPGGMECIEECPNEGETR